MGVFHDIQTDIELASVKMVTEYRRRLLVDALKLCGNEADAEDLVSSVFNEIFAHDDGYDPKKGELYPYLRGVLEHLYARTKRRAVNRGTVAVEPLVLASDKTLATTCTEEEIFAHSDRDALRAAIGRLSPDYRDAILLHYFSELPIAKVARVLSISEGTVKWRLCMARKVLASELGALCERGKKPLAVIVGVLLLVGAAFASWSTGLFGLLPEREEAVASAEIPADPRLCTTNTEETTISPNSELQTAITEEQQMNIKGKALAAALSATMLTLGANAEGMVAETGGQTYASLNEAVAACAKGGTITLLADVTQNVNWSNKEFVLDLNEHTFAGTGGDFIQLNGGSVEVRNGTVQGKTGASCFIAMGGATICVRDCTITGGGCGVYGANGGGTVEFRGAIESHLGGIIAPNDNAKTVAVMIFDGDYYGDYMIYNNGAQDMTGNMHVLGGKFKADPSKYVSGGFICTVDALADLPYAVVADPSVHGAAEVDGVSYASFDLALSECPVGGTVKLLTDISGPITLPSKSLTVDLNGCKITGQGDLVKLAGATVTISNGTVSAIGPASCFIPGDNAKFIIADCSINAVGIAYSTASTATVELRDGVTTTCTQFKAGAVKVDIFGGCFTLPFASGVTVYGGSFTRDPTAYLGNGMKVAYDAGGEYPYSVSSTGIYHMFTTVQRTVTFEAECEEATTVTILVGTTNANIEPVVEFDAPAGSWTKAVRVSNFGTYYYKIRYASGSAVRESDPALFATKDLANYVWRDVDGNWCGEWNDSAHWVSTDFPEDCEYPNGSSSAASFENVPPDVDLVITLSGSFTAKSVVFAKGASVTMRGEEGGSTVRSLNVPMSTTFSGLKAFRLDRVRIWPNAYGGNLTLDVGVPLALENGAAFKVNDIVLNGAGASVTIRDSAFRDPSSWNGFNFAAPNTKVVIDNAYFYSGTWRFAEMSDALGTQEFIVGGRSPWLSTYVSAFTVPAANSERDILTFRVPTDGYQLAADQTAIVQPGVQYIGNGDDHNPFMKDSPGKLAIRIDRDSPYYANRNASKMTCRLLYWPSGIDTNNIVLVKGRGASPSTGENVLYYTNAAGEPVRSGETVCGISVDLAPIKSGLVFIMR